MDMSDELICSLNEKWDFQSLDLLSNGPKISFVRITQPMGREGGWLKLGTHACMELRDKINEIKIGNSSRDLLPDRLSRKAGIVYRWISTHVRAHEIWRRIVLHGGGGERMGYNARQHPNHSMDGWMEGGVAGWEKWSRMDGV